MWQILIIVLVVIVLFLFECKRELGFFQVTQFDLSTSKLDSLKNEKTIVLLADLHNKVYANKNDVLLEAIRKQNPDLILIAGDMIVGKEGVPYDTTIDFIQKLPEICPVYYSLGNHEQRMKENPEKYGTECYANYEKAVSESGVRILQNTSDKFDFDGLPIRIYGLKLPMETYTKFKRHIVTGKDIKKYIGPGEQAEFQILIAHNPLFFPAYKRWGADLTVSGHLHGGMVRIPKLGAVITPQAQLFPKYDGDLTVEGEQAILVSKGLGTHTINLRFCNYAEVVVLHLKPRTKQI